MKKEKRTIPPVLVAALVCLIFAMIALYMALTRQIAIDEAYQKCNDFYQGQLDTTGQAPHLTMNLTINISGGEPHDGNKNPG